MDFLPSAPPRFSPLTVIILLLSPLLALPGSGALPSTRGAAPAASAPSVATFALSQPTAYPVGVTTDGAGSVWFAEDNLDSIAELIPSNSTLRTFPIPTQHHLAWIWFILVDPQGNLWFSDESQSLLWEFDPSTGTFANFTAGGAFPMVLTYDSSESRIWFTSLVTDQIGYFDIAGETAHLGKVVNISAPLPGAGLAGVQVDVRGNVFVAESFEARILELDGQSLSILKSWDLPKGSEPVGLALDEARGRLWFTNHASSFFGYVDLNDSAYAEYPTSLYSSGGAYIVTLPYWIHISTSGDVWFNEHFANRIARFDPSTQQLSEFDIPTNNSSPLMLALDDARGSVWFTEFSGNSVGRVWENSSQASAVRLSVSSANLGPSATLTADSSSSPSAPPSVSVVYSSTGDPKPGFLTRVQGEGSSYQVQFTAAQALPGSYEAAVCFTYSASNQCGYVTLSIAGPESTLLLVYGVYAGVAAGLAALLLALWMEHRRGQRRLGLALGRDLLANSHPAAPTAAATPTATGISCTSWPWDAGATTSFRTAE